MKPFSFRLNRILNYRSYLEKKARRELLNAKNAYEGRERALERLAKQRTVLEKRCKDEGSKGVDVARYQIYRSFLRKLNRDLERGHMDLKRLAQNVKAQEGVLKMESIKKKTLETLKDLQFENYVNRSQREEQKAMDELILMTRERKG